MQLRIKKKQAALALALSCLLFSAGCAYQASPSAYPAESDVPGFFHGILHGFTMIFSLVAELFSDRRIYAFPNSGAWYDFGYVIGAIPGVLAALIVVSEAD